MLFFATNLSYSGEPETRNGHPGCLSGRFVQLCIERIFQIRFWMFPVENPMQIMNNISAAGI